MASAVRFTLWLVTHTHTLLKQMDIADPVEDGPGIALYTQEVGAHTRDLCSCATAYATVVYSM